MIRFGLIKSYDQFNEGLSSLNPSMQISFEQLASVCPIGYECCDGPPKDCCDPDPPACERCTQEGCQSFLESMVQGQPCLRDCECVVPYRCVAGNCAP